MRVLIRAHHNAIAAISNPKLQSKHGISLSGDRLKAVVHLGTTGFSLSHDRLKAVVHLGTTGFSLSGDRLKAAVR